MSHKQSNIHIRDTFILQSLPTSCAIKCQQLILHAYGIDVSEKQLIEIAVKNEWFDPERGTFMRCNGHLLGCFGITYRHMQYATLSEAMQEIRQRHMVMVNVNKHKLSGAMTPYPDACHSILINEINNHLVYITDTALGLSGIKHSTDDLMKAWEDSQFYMLATNTPAEYGYHSVMRKMYKLK